MLAADGLWLPRGGLYLMGAASPFPPHPGLTRFSVVGRRGDAPLARTRLPRGREEGLVMWVELLGDLGGSIVLFDDPVVPVLRHDALDLGEEVLVGWRDHEPGAMHP